MRIMIADDSTLFRAGLAALLRSAEIEVAGDFASGVELVVAVHANPPDVVILDIRMPPTYTDEGLRVAEELRSSFPEVAILVLSTYAEAAFAQRVLLLSGRSGVGYLLKDRVLDLGALNDGLRRLTMGEVLLDPGLAASLISARMNNTLAKLTAREADVLREMAEGRSNLGIARCLHISVKTVEAYSASIFDKLRLDGDAAGNRRVQAVLEFLRNQ